MWPDISDAIEYETDCLVWDEITEVLIPTREGARGNNQPTTETGGLTQLMRLMRPM